MVLECTARKGNCLRPCFLGFGKTRYEFVDSVLSQFSVGCNLTAKNIEQNRLSIVDGSDAVDALAAIEELIEGRFNEDE